MYSFLTAIQRVMEMMMVMSLSLLLLLNKQPLGLFLQGKNRKSLEGPVPLLWKEFKSKHNKNKASPSLHPIFKYIQSHEQKAECVLMLIYFFRRSGRRTQIVHDAVFYIVKLNYVHIYYMLTNICIHA